MFESYAIVELMGHSRIAGKVTEITVFGTSMLQVDVPKTTRREGYTKIYSAAAVYCITPTDEHTAQVAAERFDEPAIQPYILPESPILAAKVASVYDPEDFDMDDELENEDEMVYEEEIAESFNDLESRPATFDPSELF
jgi:hypothetical protein